MKITFEWTTGAASWRMHEALKRRGIDTYNDMGDMRIFHRGKERVLDYRHVDGDIYEIVEKVHKYRQESELIDLDF